ncbi:MAG: heavy metal translocating P-type ATPase [Burkholderiaceae bacterium]|nr:heavy metal translocating P-type ATPase [Burkholderiaceae bacterium]
MTGPIACFHCGEPVERPGRWTARVDGAEREMCCAGCQAVANAIVAAGLDDYYRARTAPAPGAAIVPPELRALEVYDDAEVQARFVRSRDSDCEATLMIDGLRCGACVWLLEQGLRRRPGVEAASVNLATGRATLRWDPAATRLSALLDAIGRLGYRALPFDPREREAQIQRTSKAMFRRLFIAGLGMMQVMMYAVPVYVAGPGGIEPRYESLLRWASLLLTLPVMFYSASPFFAGAWRDLRARAVGMDVPVVIGLLAAFAASVRATVVGDGEVYFDSVTMFVFLLLAARYVEWIARRRAGRAIDAVAAAIPDMVDRVDPAGGAIERVPATRLAPGELFRVPVGERVAVDASIVEGRTAIDQSLLTGESLPVARGPGDEVPGGAINAGSPVLMRVLRTSAESAISTIERLVDRAAADKPRLAGLTERIARWFVAALLLLAAGVWFAWMQLDPARAAQVAIAVLVVSCPCALSMATPAALAAATGAAMRRGMLVARGDALDQVAACTDVVFDKTGTLTRGRPELVRVALAGDAPGAATSAQAIAIAASLESGQAHPLADAIRRAGGDAIAALLPAGERETVPGMGVEGVVDGRRYRLGSAAFVAAWHPALAETAEAADPADPQAAGDTTVWLVDADAPIARFHFRDRLRDEAREVCETLAAAGLRLHLLSGDRGAAVAQVAGALGIEAAQADASPQLKLEYVRSLQQRGRRVLMVGDGINDAPVLAAADVSVAVGRATSLARTAAAVVLLGQSLNDLPALRSLALRTRSIVRANLGWALAYNAVAIPAAALGWVPPWLAAIGMSTSSLLVVLNALRLIPAARAGRAVAPVPTAGRRAPAGTAAHGNP